MAELKRISGNAKKPKKDGSRAWVGILVAVVVSLVGLAVGAWFSWRRNRELAKLRHEKFKTKILAGKAEANLLVVKGNKAIAAKLKIIDAAEDSLRVIESDIRAEEARYEADMRAIDSIGSWDDAGVR